MTACDPPTHLELTWEFGGQLSWVTVVLREEPPGSTRLRLEHTAPVDDHWERFGPGAAGIDWDLTLLGLGEHLVTGEAVQLDEEALTGPEGMEAMIRSGEAWCAADISAGTPGEVARRAAEQTLAAYTGREAGAPPAAEAATEHGAGPEG